MESCLNSVIAISGLSRNHLAGVPQVLGVFLSSRICITLLAFQAEPMAGTAFSICASLALLFLCWAVVSSTETHAIPGVSARWVFAYLFLIAVSLFWSATESPTVALAYWIGLVADCASVYLLCRNQDSQEAWRGILQGFVAGAAIAGAIAWFLPTLPDLRIGNEDFLHPNALGYVLAIATLFSIRLARQSKAMVFLGLFCGTTLLRTLSKASIAGFAAAAIFYLLRDSHLSRRSKVAIGITAAVLIAFSWGLLETYADNYDQTNQIETLTGRTYIWSVAWEEALKTPWLGHGFYSLRFVIPVLGTFEPWQAHNELLQQFFSYGILGLIVFLGLYWSFLRDIRASRNWELRTLALAIMIFALVRGLVDTERFDVNYPLWLLTLFAFVLRRTPSEVDPSGR